MLMFVHGFEFPLRVASCDETLLWHQPDLETYEYERKLQEIWYLGQTSKGQKYLL